MATKAANKRLTREYQNIQKSPPPYIVAHPSESNILEWHYILTGPPNTPYEGGQYWGSLMFPSDYPFAPPAIRMHTPSGRFQPSTRLCLSISDFHPKSFNPAWEVSTILIGLMSFMTSEEMTTGSVGASETERKWHAARSKWWNSTGGGSASNPVPGVHATPKGVGNIKAGDGGVKFRAEWPELDEENWKWIKDNRIEPRTGKILPDPEGGALQCSPEAAALRRRLGGSSTGVGAVMQGGQAARDAGHSWVRRHKDIFEDKPTATAVIPSEEQSRQVSRTSGTVSRRIDVLYTNEHDLINCLIVAIFAILSDPSTARSRRSKQVTASKRWVNPNDSVTQNSASLPMLPNSRFRWFALLCITVVILSLVSIRSRLDGYLTIIPIRNPLSSLQASSITTPPNITRSLVIARLAEEDTEWVTQFLGGEPLLTLAIYTVDDPNAELTVPENKGHEVMVYLTYIIDHYHNLSDITLFMHSHPIAWHNNDLLDLSTVNIVRRLNNHKVMRDGYMNLRCHHDPGCPDYIHPVLDKESSDDALNIPEAVVIGKAWLELFPDATAPPKVLSQPCCAQFAVSKDKIQMIPLSQYVFYRDWLLHTPLEDKLSGRVWEYTWQYIFGGVEEFCPMESVCYCDGYGVCFEGEAEYQQWFALRKRSRALQEELHIGTGQSNEVELMSEIGHIALDLQNRKNNAFERGKDPQIRALMAGRPWKDGDGF